MIKILLFIGFLTSFTLGQNQSISCHQLAFRKNCGDLICIFANNGVPSVATIPSDGGISSIDKIPSNPKKIYEAAIQRISGEYIKSNLTTIDLFLDSKTIPNQV